MKIQNILTTIIATFVLASCATVHVTKTGSGFYEPVSPASVQILKTKPDRPYTELAVMDISGFNVTDTAKMHNAIRTKAGPIGADAVIITDTSMVPDGWGGTTKYASAVAIKYK